MLDAPNPQSIVAFAQAGPCICVHVERARGSTPRIAGTKMLVSQGALLGTIGGGQLEYIAIEAARQMLVGGEQDRTLDIPLGPEIGQCCGGHITLLLTVFDIHTAHALAASVEVANKKQPSVYIFGAGHVGRALATALLPLPVQALLLDNRDDELALIPPPIKKERAALPEAHIRSAPPGSAFVILTHDHALDFLLAQEALSRPDAAYVGMIGSKTKRATFKSWLNDQPETSVDLKRLTMPIGASKLTDKRPAVIAAMVAAEIMEHVGPWQQARTHESQENA